MSTQNTWKKEPALGLKDGELAGTAELEQWVDRVLSAKTRAGPLTGRLGTVDRLERHPRSASEG